MQSIDYQCFNFRSFPHSEKKVKMRKRFEQQLTFGITPIGEVVINKKSRHQLAPVLIALQYAFNDKELSEEIFKLLEQKLLSGKKATGRLGMSLWELLVLGVVKLSLEIDFDFLHDLANSHTELRGILGVGNSSLVKGKEYHYQTIHDNVQLLDSATIISISELIVKGAHGLLKKKEGVDCLNLVIKSDSFVVESAIHFPTDMNLLWDSCRKCIDIIGLLKKEKEGVSESCYWSGWGQYKSWYSRVKKLYRITSEIHRKKGANYQFRLEEATKNYLEVSGTLSEKVALSLRQGALYIGTSMIDSVRVGNLLKELTYYLSMLDKHRDLVNRRILQGEKIPHQEKVFSIFESHVEWNTKGKLNKKVELGHNVLIATDQYQFIVYQEVYEQQVDKSRTIAIGNHIAELFSSPSYHLSSISFDRNFYSLLAKQALNKSFDVVVLPKPGKKTAQQKEEESTEIFVEKRKKHSAVEANINQLEHHGLSVCRDKGIDGFKRYVAYGILSYNLHRMGRIIMETKPTKAAA